MQAQGQVSEYEAELETQLQERDTEATQLKEELGRLRRLSQVGYIFIDFFHIHA